jgi:hypothetical protein
MPSPVFPCDEGLRWVRVSVTSRTAVYGPVRTVVWEGRSREAPPYPDQGRLCRMPNYAEWFERHPSLRRSQRPCSLQNWKALRRKCGLRARRWTHRPPPAECQREVHEALTLMGIDVEQVLGFHPSAAHICWKALFAVGSAQRGLMRRIAEQHRPPQSIPKRLIRQKRRHRCRPPI